MDNYINKPEITVEAVYRSSAAAGPLYQWVISVVKYSEIVHKIEPLN